MGADTFEIVVKGTLGPAFVAAFEGFSVTSTETGFTRLEGWVPDQARLHGVLAMLRDMGVELVSMTHVGVPDDDHALPRTKEES